jgi:hypothetical protein
MVEHTGELAIERTQVRITVVDNADEVQAP